MKNSIILAEIAILLSRLARIGRDGPDPLGLLSAALLTLSIFFGVLWKENKDE